MKLYKVKKIYVKNFDYKEPEEEFDVIIVQCDSDNTDVWIPSKLTSYISYNYGGANRVNTKLPPARAITGFLNYISKQIDLGDDEIFYPLKIEGLYGLQFIHWAKYIDYMSTRGERYNNTDTVNGKDNYILHFYHFLYKSRITNKTAKIETKIVRVPGQKRGKVVLLNPLLDKSKYYIRRPAKIKVNRVLKDMDEDMWEQFVQYAEKRYPGIVLGLVFQIMGGLRRGELVNLILDDVDIDRKNDVLTLWLQDRPELFMDRKIDLSQSQNKKEPAEQAIYDFNGRLYEIYDNHIKILAKNANDTAKKLGALFVDDNGNTMSGEVYWSRFSKMKDEFIQIVEKVSPSQAEKLKKYTWGTHIGRHIFTNYLIKNHGVDGSDGQPNPTLLQNARRDKSPLSAQVYVDTEAIHKAVNKGFNTMSKLARKNSNSEIGLDLIDGD